LLSPLPDSSQGRYPAGLRWYLTLSKTQTNIRDARKILHQFSLISNKHPKRWHTQEDPDELCQRRCIRQLLLKKRGQGED